MRLGRKQIYSMILYMGKINPHVERKNTAYGLVLENDFLLKYFISQAMKANFITLKLATIKRYHKKS